MFNVVRLYLLSFGLLAGVAVAQQPAGLASQPPQRITGSITAVDQAAHTVTVKEDKTGTVYVVELQNTKSLRKVDPSTLDLKTATHITPEDLMVGDRVQVFAVKAEDNSNAVAARALILVSGRELKTVHQEQAAAWQHATSGVVTQVDSTAGKISISARTPEGRKPMVVDAQKAEFTRYASASPKTPAISKLADIQTGDQVRVIGEAGGDGSTLMAQKLYSSPVRAILCTVSSIAPDGKSLTVNDLQTKQTVTVSLNDDSAVRKLPPMMAAGLARRLNPAANAGNARAGADTANSAAGSQAGAKQGEAAGAPNGGWRGGAGAGPAGSGSGGAGGPGGGSGAFRADGGMRNGDVSQLIARLPKISVTDLKPGDAVVISGAPVDNDRSHLLATNVIAGVEPIFQSASPRQMQSLGDWGLGSGTGGEGGMDGAPPQ